MVELEGFQAGSRSACPKELSRNYFAIVVADFEVEGSPSVDKRNDELEDTAKFHCVECDASGVIFFRDGIDEDVEEVGGRKRAAGDVGLGAFNVCSLSKMEGFPQTLGSQRDLAPVPAHVGHGNLEVGEGGGVVILVWFE